MFAFPPVSQRLSQLLLDARHVESALRLQFIHVLGKAKALRRELGRIFHVQGGEQVLRLGQLGFGPLTINPSDQKLRLGSSGLGPEAILLQFYELQLVLGEACVRLGKLHTVGGAHFDSGEQSQGVGGDGPLITFSFRRFRLGRRGALIRAAGRGTLISS